MAANEYYNPAQPDHNETQQDYGEAQDRVQISGNNDNYRAEVQNRVQALVAGTRPRDPRLSSFSTRRLILEAVVEELRIYRVRRQREVIEMAAKERRKRRRRERSREGRHHRHRDGDHHDRDGKDGAHHHGRRHGDGDEERRRRHRSRSGHRGERRHKHLERSKSRRKSLDRELSDLVIEGQPDASSEFMMTGGAGPVGTVPAEQIPQDESRSPTHHLKRRSGLSNLRPPPPDGAAINEQPPRPQTPHPHARSRSPHRRIRTTGKPSAALAGLYQPPQRQVGPDGVTPFGSVPSRTAGVGLAARFMNTYRHIKAEHDAGHRERGVLERTVDGWRGKGAKPQASQAEKPQEGRHGEDRKRPKGKYFEATENERRDVGNGRGKVWMGGEMEMPIGYGLPELPPKTSFSRTSSTEAEFTRPPSPAPLCDMESPWPSDPDPNVLQAPPSPSPPAGSANPSLIELAQTGLAPSAPPSPFIPPPPPMPMLSSLQPSPPPPPPPPKPNSNPPRSPPAHSSLLSQICKAPALRKVPASQVKDNSSAPGAGHVYEATEHSREVEERERREEREEAGRYGEWSGNGDGDGEEEMERRRRLRRDLLGGR